jgi:hypothetical protein
MNYLDYRKIVQYMSYWKSPRLEVMVGRRG